MSEILRVAAALRRSSDEELRDVIAQRMVSSSTMRDFFDLADALTKPSAVSSTVAGLSRTQAIALQAIADGQFLDGSRQFFCKGVIDTGLHIDAVRTNAGLAVVAELGDHRAFDSRIQIGIIEHDERRVAAQFHRAFQHLIRRLTQKDAADFGRAGESQLADRGFSQNSLPISDDRDEVITENTPAGTPARSARTARAIADSGVSAAGRATKPQPAARAAQTKTKLRRTPPEPRERKPDCARYRRTGVWR